MWWIIPVIPLYAFTYHPDLWMLHPMLDFTLEQDPRDYKPVDYPKLVEEVHEPMQIVSKKKKVKKGKLLLSTSLPIHTNTKTK